MSRSNQLICNDIKRRVYAYLPVSIHNKINTHAAVTIPTDNDEHDSDSRESQLIKPIAHPLSMCNRDYLHAHAHEYTPEHFGSIISTIWFDVNHVNTEGLSILDLIVYNNRVDLLPILLRDALVDPNTTHNKAIEIVTRRGSVRMMDILLKDGRADPQAYGNMFMHIAAKEGNNGVVVLLLKDGRADPASHTNKAIRTAVSCRNVQLVSILMKDPRVDPSDDRNSIIRLATIRENITVIALLLEDSRVNPFDSINQGRNAMRCAVQEGYVEIVTLFLQNSHCDGEAICEAISNAINYKRFDIVDILIDAMNSYEAAEANRAIYSVIKVRRADILDRLLSNPKFILTKCGQFLYRACQCGHLDIVNRLLEDPRLDSIKCTNQCLCLASRQGHLDVVDRLLKWKMVDLGEHNSKVMYVAVKGGHIDVVELLLSDHRIDPTAKHNRAVLLAAERGYIDIVRLFIADERVDLTGNTDVIWIASVCSHDDIVKLLLEHGCVMP